MVGLLGEFVVVGNDVGGDGGIVVVVLVNEYYI